MGYPCETRGMSKAIVGMGCAVLAAGAAAFFVQRADNRAMRQEISLLRAEVSSTSAAARRRADAAPAPQMTAMVTADRAYTATEDVTSLKEELVALRKSTQDLTRLAQAAQLKQSLEADSAKPVNITPAAALKNAGKGSPEATAETILWAAVGGDVDTLANALEFTPGARAQADAWFAGLSPSTREQYGSPEKVIALMIAKDAAALNGMQVLGQREVAPDTIGMRLRFASNDGKTKDDNLLMHRASDGWRLLLPEQTLTKFAKQLAGR